MANLSSLEAVVEMLLLVSLVCTLKATCPWWPNTRLELTVEVGALLHHQHLYQLQLQLFQLFQLQHQGTLVVVDAVAIVASLDGLLTSLDVASDAEVSSCILDIKRGGRVGRSRDADSDRECAELASTFFGDKSGTALPVGECSPPPVFPKDGEAGGVTPEGL